MLYVRSTSSGKRRTSPNALRRGRSALEDEMLSPVATSAFRFKRSKYFSPEDMQAVLATVTPSSSRDQIGLRFIQPTVRGLGLASQVGNEDSVDFAHFNRAQFLPEEP